MIGEQVILSDMLTCREHRAQLQTSLIKQYHCPVISFCMNIPGPIKTNEQIRSAFNIGKELLLDRLQENNMEIKKVHEIHEKTGDELLLAVDASAKRIKNLAVAIEENHPFGRIFDIDIIDVDGLKLSRNNYRKCIICDCQAQKCARMRKHSIEEIKNKIDSILNMS